MKFKTLLTINSALAVVFGTACMVAPAQLLANYDVSLEPMGLVIYQFWGVSLIGLGMFAWFARCVEDPVLLRKFKLALFVTNGLSSVMAVRGQNAGANSIGWSRDTTLRIGWLSSTKSNPATK